MEKGSLMAQFMISGFSDEIDTNIDIQFQALNNMGITYFETRGVNGKNVADLTDEELAALIAKMKDYGIQVSSVGSPIGKIKITDAFEPHFEKFKRVVAIAKALGTRYIRMFSFFIPKDEDPCKYRDEVFARLAQMIAYAKEEDVVLLHENEKEIYGDTTGRCLELMETFCCEHFKAVFDPANFIQCKQDTKDAFDKLSPYVEYMHIKDALADGSVVPAGKGIGNLSYILKALKDKGYSGFLSLEPHLGSFSGLENLENDDTMTKLEKSNEEKFALAYDSLKAILERS